MPDAPLLDYYKPSEVARLLGIYTSTMNRWIAQGKIPSQYIMYLPSNQKLIHKDGFLRKTPRNTGPKRKRTSVTQEAEDAYREHTAP